MKKDIETLEEIELFVKQFYKTLCELPEMDHLYNKVIQINWEHHIPIMVNFWGSLILREGKYKGDILAHHQKVMKVIPLTRELFRTWEECFIEVLDSLYEGQNCNKTKKRVVAMSKSLIQKLNI